MRRGVLGRRYSSLALGAPCGLYDSQDSWPLQPILDGSTYDPLEGRPEVRAGQRLGWLRRDPRGYVPQPYEQLAAAYRAAGQPERARLVMIAKQWYRRRTLKNPLGKAWNWLLWATVGYGYRPRLAGVWLLMLVGSAGQSSTVPIRYTFSLPNRRANDHGSTRGYMPWTYCCVPPASPLGRDLDAV